jgi:hypothetical protein
LLRRLVRDSSLRLALQDWSLHPALQADLQLALGRALPVALGPLVVPAVAEAVLVLDL